MGKEENTKLFGWQVQDDGKPKKVKAPVVLAFSRMLIARLAKGEGTRT